MISNFQTLSSVKRAAIGLNGDCISSCPTSATDVANLSWRAVLQVRQAREATASRPALIADWVAAELQGAALWLYPLMWLHRVPARDIGTAIDLLQPDSAD